MPNNSATPKPNEKLQELIDDTLAHAIEVIEAGEHLPPTLFTVGIGKNVTRYFAHSPAQAVALVDKAAIDLEPTVTQYALVYINPLTSTPSIMIEAEQRSEEIGFKFVQYYQMLPFKTKGELTFLEIFKERF